MINLKFQPPQFNNYPPFNYFEKNNDEINFSNKIRDEIVLFMHLPFCMQKCGYCALSSVIRDPAELDPIISAIKKEIDLYSEKLKNRKVVAALLGGGTPSNLRVDQIEDLYGHLYKSFNFTRDAEITVEVRPNTINAEKIIAFKNSGVNRISFGIQTLNLEELRLCGRQNTEELVKNAMDIVKDCGIDNINFDIIAGLPKQTKTSFEETCKIIFGKLKPNHVSLYCLIVHPETAFAHLFKKQPEIFPNDEQKASFYDSFFKTAKKYGYIQTSTENVAINDDNCSHYQRLNWMGYERLALGPEAIGFIGENQYINKSWKNGYLENVDKNIFPSLCSFNLNKEQLLRRRIILGLHNQFLDKSEMSNFYGDDIGIKFKDVLDDLKNNSLITENNQKIELTELGKKYLYQVQISFYEDYLNEGQRGLAGVTKR